MRLQDIRKQYGLPSVRMLGLKGTICDKHDISKASSEINLANVMKF